MLFDDGEQVASRFFYAAATKGRHFADPALVDHSDPAEVLGDACGISFGAGCDHEHFGPVASGLIFERAQALIDERGTDLRGDDDGNAWFSLIQWSAQHRIAGKLVRPPRNGDSSPLP